jgi:hypothetical protein
MNALHVMLPSRATRSPVMIARIASFLFGIVAPPALVGWLVFLH